MEVTQKDVLETAALLNIEIKDEEMEGIVSSFISLINCFSVLDKVKIDETSLVFSDNICRYRDDEASTRHNTESLIERSGEYEDNCVLIPNIL